MIDLNQPGAYARAGGGNQEIPQFQMQAVDWIAWNLDNGTDPPQKGAGIPAFANARKKWAAAGLANFPWVHVRSMADLTRLIAAGEQFDAPAIGCNIENIVGDNLPLQQVGGYLLDFWVNPYGKPVHFPTLDWVQNGQGWQYMSFCNVALEIFPGEGSMRNGYDPVICQQCIDHALAEGCEKVTLMFKTKGLSPSTYGAQWSICHSLYTSDDIPPTQTAWATWKLPTACRPITKEKPVPLTEKQFPYTGPFYEGDRNHPTIKGLKRGQIRLGNLGQQLGNETDDFGPALKEALKKFQRDVGVQATGAYGRGTHQALRYARVPPESPHAGEYAMDALALKYVREDALTMCYPHPKDSLSQICQGLHQTAGLSGNWAIDFCAPGGTKVLAVERAKITKLSGRDPAQGADNTVGIFGWSIHMETPSGIRHFSTHYGARSPLTVGQIVDVGQVLGTVGHWPGDPTRSHTHWGCTHPLGPAAAKKHITAISQATKVVA